MDLGLYVITASVPELGRDHYDVAAAAIEGGATAIQLRIKRRSMGEALKIAYAVHKLTTEAGIPLFINDHVGIAMASKAEGLHVGPDDISLQSARRMLGQSARLGRSTAGKLEEVVKVEKEGADYLAVGPIYETKTKKTDKQTLGPEILSKVTALVKIPVIAIGGINADNVAECIAAGADGVAVISAVSGAEDMVAATAELKHALESARASTGKLGSGNHGK